MSLGSIVVRLSMNTADFETDAGRAAKTAQKRAKEIDASFRKAGVAIGAALGTAAVGVVVALKGAIDTMDETYNAAKKVGDSTENFSRLNYAAGLADLQMDQLVTTMGKLTKSQAAALDPGSKQAAMFKALGIEVEDANGKLRGSTDVLLDFADRFKEMQGSPEAMAAGFALFGRSFQDLIPLLEQGSDEIRRLMGESDALGRTVTDEAGAAADQLKDDMDRLTGAIGGAWMEIASGMMPQLTAMAGEMVVAAKQTDDLRQFGEGLATVLGALGKSLAFVAGMARQFGIDMATAVEISRGMLEINKNLSTFGMADGSISDGKARIDAALKTRRELLDQAKTESLVASAATSLARTKAGLKYVEYNGPLLDMGKPQADPADAYRKRLALVLGGGVSGARGGSAKSKKAELTDEQKALNQLNDEYDRELAGMKEHLGLLGLETEAARTQWEVDNGRFRDLKPMQKAALVAEAALYDAKQKAIEKADDEKRAREEAKKGYEDAIKAIREEAETLGMTNEQLEIYNNQKRAGAEANSAFGRSIAAETEMLQKQRKSTEDQIFLMDGMRGAAQGFLDDLYHGVDVWEALGNAARSFADTLFDIASRRLIEEIFGQTGSSQTGSAGSGLWGIFSSIVGSFFGGGASASSGGGGGGFGWIGNGYASGGWTGPGGMNEVRGPAHADEVIWSKADNARHGGAAAVDAMRRGAPGKAGKGRQRIIIVDDKRDAEAMMRGPAGEEAFLVHAERNLGRLKEMVLAG